MRKFTVLAALIVAPLLVSTASAEEDKAEVVKYRQLEMGATARHFGAIKRLVKGQVDRPQDLLGHTAALVELSKDIPAQFPAGTGPDDKFETEALKKVWTDADGFAKAASTFELATAALHAAAEKRDMTEVAAAYEKVGDACGGCHDTYKLKD